MASKHERLPSQVEVDEPKKGELRKKSAHLGVYRRRNILLNAVGMQIYDLGEIDKPRSIVPITADTTVSEITLESIRGNHGAAHPNQAVFQVVPNDNLSVSTHHSYRPRIFGSSTEEHWFSAPTLEIAKSWKEAIEERAKSLATARSSREPRTETSSATIETQRVTIAEPEKPSSETKGLVSYGSLTLRDEKVRVLRERMKRTASMHIRSLPKPVHTTINLIQQAQWREVLVTNGLRIMAEMALAKDNPCLRVSCVLPTSVDRAFALYYDFDRRSQWDSVTESAELLNEEDDGHLRTIHFKVKGQKVSGLWMAPRDFVVDSSWRKDDDGSIVIIETSNKDRQVPETKGYVRAEIYALGVTLCPRRKGKKATGEVGTTSSRRDVTLTPESESEDTSCLLQMAVHANCGGWLSKLPLEWGQHWLYNFMLRVIGFRAVLEEENYQMVDFQSLSSNRLTEDAPKTAPQRSHSETERVQDQERAQELAVAQGKPVEDVKVYPLPQVEGTLSKELVYNIAEPFNLRSKTYLEDKKKEASIGTMFDLIAMDLLELDEHVENVAANLKGGLAQKYLATPGPKPYLFIVQFQVPGPPNLAFIAYFAAKPGAIDTISPFSRLFADFVDGTDAFRDSRFKFIPRVVKGSYVVKSAVGQTPALLGNKLACFYHKGDGYFEIDVDVSSSNVAGGILRVVKGYVSSLSIDMCFLLEAQREEELPEVVLGSFRFERLSLDMAKKWKVSE